MVCKFYTKTKLVTIHQNDHFEKECVNKINNEYGFQLIDKLVFGTASYLS